MAQIFGESIFNSDVSIFGNQNISNNLTIGSLSVSNGVISATSGTASFYGNSYGTLTGNVNLTGNLTTPNLLVTGITTILGTTTLGTTILGSNTAAGTVTVGVGTTALLVSGNTRVTGTLSIGTSSVTINGSTNVITGVSTVTDPNGFYLSVPPGAIMWFAANSAPAGFVKCNGASLTASTYSALFNVIQYTHGGSGANFNVPDLRGEFVRGWDDGKGTDSGRSFASSQAEMINQHRHWISAASIDDRNFTGSGGNTQDLGLVSDAGSYSSTDPNSAAGRFSRNDPGFGSNNETRPRNIALLACIKY